MRCVCLFLCLCSLLLAACGPRGDEDDGSLFGLNPVPVPAQPGGIPTTSEGVTITFAAWETEIRSYESIAARFHQENPTINVVIVSMDALLNASEDTTTDDISRMRHIVMGADTTVEMGISPEVADSGLLLNMKPLMEADASFKQDDFYPGVLARGTFGQRLLVLPRYAWVRLLSYNKDLFRAAGLPDPKPDWTWDDLFGFASQIAAYDSTDYGFFDDSRGLISMFSEIEARKLKIFSVPTSDVDLTQPELVHTFEHFKGMIDNHTIYTASSQNTTAPDDPQQLIRDGRVGIFPSALLLSSSAGLSWSPMGNNDYSFSVGHINAPPSDAVLATLGADTIDGYIISAGTQHPNEAWRWIAYLSRTVIDLGSDDTDMMSRPGRIPARQSLAEATTFWETMDADTKTAAQHALAQQVVRLAHTPDYPTLGALMQAIYAVTKDARQPADALKAAQDQLTSQLAEDAKATATTTPPTGAVVVATPAPQVATDGAVTLVFNPLGYDTAALRIMARTFNEQKNGYFVQITATDVTTSPVSLAEAAKSADCFAWWYTPQGPDDRAALLDLQPFFLADTRLRQDDIPPAVRSQLTSNGGIYGLPYTVKAHVLAYNKTMFDAAGLNPPIYTWRPDDFLAAAIALTHGSGDTKQYGYIPLRGPARDLAFFIAQFGGQIATGSGKDVQPNFSDPTVVKAIQWYIDLAKVHGVMPRFTLPYRPNDATDDTAYALIHAGRGGMWIDSGDGAFPVSRDGSDPTITWQPGLAPLPIGGAGMQRDDLAVRSFYISAQTQQQQGCWEWLTFITSHGHALNGEVPARQSVATSPEFLSSANEIQLQTLKVYGEAFTQPSKLNPGIDELSQLSSYGFDLYWFYKAIDDTIMKHADLAEGLRKADELTKANMTCVAKMQQPAFCATQTDPEYDGFATKDPGQNHPNGAMDALR